MKYYFHILLYPIYLIGGLLIPCSASAVVNGGTKEIKVGESIKLEVERSTYYTVTGSWTKEGNSAYISSRSNRSCTVTGSQPGTTTIRWKGVIGSTDSEWYWTIKVTGNGSDSGNGGNTSGSKSNPDTGFSDNWESNGNYSMSWYEKEKMEYHLSTAEELAGFAYLVNQGYTTFKGKTVKLDGDVDLYGKNWPMIGVTTGSYDKVFEGTFDGQNHTISGIYIVSCKDNLRQIYGFWERLSNATIKNVRLKGIVNIENSTPFNRGYLPETTAGNAYVGGLVGISSNSLFENCRVDMDVTYKRDHKLSHVILGGIAGLCTAKTGVVALRYCSHNGSLYVSDWDGTFCPPLIGGIIGSGSGVIEYCENFSAVIEGSLPSSNHDHPSSFTMGGIVGNGGIVKFCRSIVKRMTATNYCQGSHYFTIGGIVGNGTSVTNSYCVIEKCEVNTVGMWYGSGKVQIGGIMSSSNSGSTANFSNSDMERICGTTIQEGYHGSTDYSASQMKEDGFLDEINRYPQINLGKSIWTSDENGYPCIAQAHEESIPDTNEPTSISVSPSSETIKVGESFTISYTLSPSNATTTVTWTSDNTNIATVSASGKVTGVKTGSTYINATTSNGKTDWCKVTVESGPTKKDIAINSTNFPDDNFRKYLMEQDYGKDGVITADEISEVISIDVEDKHISDLSGIELFSALTYLDCESNPLTSLDVSKNTGLTYLKCSSNQLTSLDVSKNTGLTSLDCRSNQLTSLDVSKNKQLTLLDCTSNPLTSLDLTNNTNLTRLYCQDTQITSLNITNNVKLTELYIENNKLTSIDVSKNTNLVWLYCNNNKLTQLDISNNKVLSYLYCYKNNLISLDASKNTSLIELNCSKNQLTKLIVANNSDLSSLTCDLNQIKGSAMDELIGSLPNNSEGDKYDLNLLQSNSAEGNRCTKEQVDAAKAKGWIPYIYENWKWVEYSPSSNSIEINAANFPDANFLNYLLAQDYGKDGEITDFELPYITTINVKDKGISSLEGIWHFTYLETLSANSNQLTYLDVSKNTALKTLYCSSNQLTSLDLSKNVALSYLSCESNPLTSLDVSKNTALTTLYCRSNQLTYLDVSKNTALKTLWADSNQLTSLDVTKNTALTTLYCSSNKLTSLDITKNTALTSLNCNSNQLTSLDVSKNTALTSLNCNSNQLTYLDVSKNTALTYLSCYSNQLASLDVTKNTALTTLYCYSNQLASLDVTKNTALTTLYCSSNKLTSLDITKNTALTSLNCNSNQLTYLDVSKNTALTYLSCYSNQLASLDVTKNTALTTLYCYSNQLASLDVTKNTALTTLYCYSNQLSSLDVSKNTALTSLYCYNNPINGSAVDKLINSLPKNATSEEHKIYIIREKDNIKIICTISQVADIKAKGWTPFYHNGTEWVEYEGNDDTPKSISLPTSVTINVDETIALKPTLTPEDAKTTLSWQSDDTSIAKVSQSGIVMGIKEGTAIVSVTTSNNLKAECFVVVKDLAGINDVEMDNASNRSIYTLSGQRLSKPRKGINIIDGKKVVVK